MVPLLHTSFASGDMFGEQPGLKVFLCHVSVELNQIWLLCLCPPEVLYEDLQYLSVSALALACVAALLMLAVWLLDKAYRKIVAWRQRKQMPGK